MNTQLPVLALLLAACAAAPNPDLDQVATVNAPKQAAKLPVTPPSPADQEQAEASSTVLEPAAASLPTVGAVGGVDVSVDEFLARLWVRDSSRTRDVLEQIVLERLTLLEAERLGLGVAPAQVEALVAEVYSSMATQLAAAGSELSAAEHIRQNLEMNLAFYEQHVRSDAIVRLLTERCVRAWSLQSERAIVDVLELREESVLESVRAGLEQGRSFEELAAEFGPERLEGGAERLSLVRSERHPLSRLAFATTPGEVGGPLVQGSSYVLLRVREHLPADPFEPGSSPERLVESLAETEVDNLEFVQWRAAMVRRYTVDLVPFFELVGDPGPQ